MTDSTIVSSADVAETASPAEETGAPVVRHQLGETRVTIAPKFRGRAGVRPSTFETTDYGYVVHDLRRVAVVAGVLLAFLIMLSFVIR